MHAFSSAPIALFAVVWFTAVILYFVWAIDVYERIGILNGAKKAIQKSMDDAVIEALKENPGAKLGMHMNIPVMYVRNSNLNALYGLNGERRN